MVPDVCAAPRVMTSLPPPPVMDSVLEMVRVLSKVSSVMVSLPPPRSTTTLVC